MGAPQHARRHRRPGRLGRLLHAPRSGREGRRPVQRARAGGLRLRGGGPLPAAAFDDVGPFDESFFAYVEDIDWGLRAQLAGWRCFYEPAAVAYHVGGATAAEMSGFELFQNHRNTIVMMIKNFPLPALIVAGPWAVARRAVSLLKAATRGEGTGPGARLDGGRGARRRRRCEARREVQRRRRSGYLHLARTLRPAYRPRRRGAHQAARRLLALGRSVSPGRGAASRASRPADPDRRIGAESGLAPECLALRLLAEEASRSPRRARCRGRATAAAVSAAALSRCRRPAAAAAARRGASSVSSRYERPIRRIRRSVASRSVGWSCSASASGS